MKNCFAEVSDRFTSNKSKMARVFKASRKMGSLVHIAQRCFSAKLFLILALTILFGAYQKASAETYYTTTGIGSFRTIGNPNSIAYAMNSSGQVVGFANTDIATGSSNAFLWDSGTLTNIGAMIPYYSENFGYATSTAYGINDAGTIVGTGEFSAGRTHAFVLENGVLTDLNPLIWQSGVFTNLENEQHVYSNAFKINNVGQILGTVYSNNVTQTFIYHNGLFVKIDIPGCGNMYPSSINDSGTVTVICSQGGNFVWSAGVITNIGSLEGKYTAAYDINNSGQVVGTSVITTSLGDYARAFRYDMGGMTNLGALVPGAFSQAQAINNSGHVVGWGVANPITGEAHGFVYRNNALTDINELTQFSSEGYLRECTDINDQGQIICVRKIVNGWYRSEVLTPVQDTTAPQIYASNLFFAASSATGAVVDYSFALQDDWDRTPSVAFSHPPGTLLPIGATTVSYSLSDDSGNIRVGTFNITIIDTAPNLLLPETIFTDATSAAGATVTYVTSASDAVSGDLPTTCSHASGSVFPVGETTVTCTATDGVNNISSAGFQIVVMTSEQEVIMPGYDVPVVSSDSGLSLTFAYVDRPGVTTIAPIDPGTIGTTPSGFAVSDAAYEISTTSVGATDNGVLLAFVVPNSANMTSSVFELLRVLHNNNGTLEDITYSYDYDNRIVYAYTYSFSPFYLVRTVTTNIETLFDRSNAYKAGSTIPVKLRVRDGATNANLSASSLTVTARSVKRLGNGTALTAGDSGSANPDNNFRYLGEKDGGTYIFNLSTKGLQAGSYALSFYVGTDRSFFYSVKFEVK